MADQILSQSAYTAIINAPIDTVDIANWLLHLPAAEYQRCCAPDHIACGATATEDGRPMSINVEQIGDALMIQQYVGEITDSRHCRMVSQSNAITADGRTKVQVVWDLSVKPIDSEHCEYTNSVVATAPSDVLTLGQAAADHNRRETPMFAKSIERSALAAHGAARMLAD